MREATDEGPLPRLYPTSLWALRVEALVTRGGEPGAGSSLPNLNELYRMDGYSIRRRGR